MKDLIENCIFIHDDTESEFGVDWDRHALNPFLLGVNNCVSGNLRGFGDGYIEYLKSINAYPKNVLEVSEAASSVTKGLLWDKSIQTKLAEICDRDIGISVFYSDTSKLELVEALSKISNKKIHLIPSYQHFKEYNNKLNMRKILSQRGVPLPYGEICEGIKDLKLFFKAVNKKYKEILIKKNHWDTLRVSNIDMLDFLCKNLDFPVIAEVAYSIIASPVSHNYVWNGKSNNLFIVMQKILDFKHAGNYIPTGLPQNVNDKITSISNEIINTMIGFEGVIGIDFIITDDDEIYPVDVNPRFNSSTYPFYYLSKLGIDFSSTFANYSFLKCNIPNLSILLNDPLLFPFSLETQEGIILFSPSYNAQKEKVEKISYLCVGRSAEKIKDIEENFFKLLDRYK